MIIAIVPILVAVIGLLIYVWPKTNAQITEVGRILFAFGVLVSLLVAANHVVRVP